MKSIETLVAQANGDVESISMKRVTRIRSGHVVDGILSGGGCHFAGYSGNVGISKDPEQTVLGLCMSLLCRNAIGMRTQRITPTRWHLRPARNGKRTRTKVG